jgi:hypothetical protein
LDLFDIKLDPEVLVQLRHLDDEARKASRTNSAMRPELRQNGSGTSSRSARERREREKRPLSRSNPVEYHSGSDREHRRRSASYPGPVPGFTSTSSSMGMSPDLGQSNTVGRKRGSTISQIQSSSSGDEY